MTISYDMAMCLQQQEKRPEMLWSDILKMNDDVNAAIDEGYRIMNFRSEAGWESDEGGWTSPEGISESTWEDWGLAFPENPEEYQKAITSQDYRDMMAEQNLLNDSCHARLC